MTDHDHDDLPRPAPPPPFEPPALLDDDTFRATPTYAALCGQFGQDPDTPWGLMKFDSLTAAAEFLCLYHRAKADLAPWTASQVAAYYEMLTLAHEPDRGGLVWADRHGHVLVVIDPRGRWWLGTFTPADPATMATAMTRAHINDTPLS
jgi:hypothetical protein